MEIMTAKATRASAALSRRRLPRGLNQSRKIAREHDRANATGAGPMRGVLVRMAGTNTLGAVVWIVMVNIAVGVPGLTETEATLKLHVVSEGKSVQSDGLKLNVPE